MKKYVYIISMIAILLFDFNVNALSNEIIDNSKLLSRAEKYYKTVYSKKSENSTLSNNIYEGTFEITKEEYENANISNNVMSASIETTYKKMTTSIFAQNTRYKYQVELEWKNYPSVRSYDIIGIGFPASVKASGTPTFKHEYCNSNGCKSIYSYHSRYISNNGVGVLFKLPTGTLTKLKQTLSINVDKNTTATIIKQNAYGDYAHATKTITSSNAEKYKVDCSGIVHDASAIKSYDSISPAIAQWNGTW